jgi:hypothetical protein
MGSGEENPFKQVLLRVLAGSVAYLIAGMFLFLLYVLSD